MTWRLLRETLWRRKGRVGLALLTIVVGVSLAVALLSISSNILEKMGQELRSYGANISVTPRSERVSLDVRGVGYAPAASAVYIDENELVKLKTIFWRNNILGFTPLLSTPVRVGEGSGTAVVLTGTWFEKEISLAAGSAIRTTFSEDTVIREKVSIKTGARSVFPWWQVKGQWPADDDRDSVLVGASLARRLKVGPGDVLPVEYGGNAYRLRVAGILATGVSRTTRS